MIGVIQQLKNGLGVTFSVMTSDTFVNLTLPLHPYISTEGLYIGKIVKFDVERFYETGIEDIFDVAVVDKQKKKKKKNGKGNNKI